MTNPYQPLVVQIFDEDRGGAREKFSRRDQLLGEVKISLEPLVAEDRRRFSQRIPPPGQGQIELIVTWLPSSQPQPAPSPPSEFVYVTTSMTWSDARTYCQGLGGDLASIHSAEEDAEAAELATGENVWFGLTDADEEGKASLAAAWESGRAKREGRA